MLAELDRGQRQRGEVRTVCSWCQLHLRDSGQFCPDCGEPVVNQAAEERAWHRTAWTEVSAWSRRHHRGRRARGWPSRRPWAAGFRVPAAATSLRKHGGVRVGVATTAVLCSMVLVAAFVLPGIASQDGREKRDWALDLSSGATADGDRARHSVRPARAG